MKIPALDGRIFSLMLALGLVFTGACGTDSSGNAQALSMGAKQDALHHDDADDDDDAGDDGDDGESEEPSDTCDEIQARLRKDGMAMSRTQEFRAVVKTPEYKQLVKDIQDMQKADCSLTDNTSLDPTCIRLKLRAYKHQRALMNTPEFKKLAKTAEFKKVTQDFQDAQENGCMNSQMTREAFFPDPSDTYSVMWLHLAP